MSKQKITYNPIHIGKFESDDLTYSAVVIYWTDTERHVTVWKHGFKVIDQQMTKSDWESVRDEKGLVLVDIQTAKFPIN